MDSTPSPQQPTDAVTPTPPPPPATPGGVAAEPPPADDTQLTPGVWLKRNGPYLLLLAVIITFFGWKFGLDNLWYFFLGMLGLGLVIFVHELGHFAVAKWCDVHVETFSIGFGPALPGCRWQWGETVYKIALFPLGGYVKMLGEGADGDEEDAGNNPRSYKNKTVGQRMMIISAGVVMNVILACVCFTAVFFHGKERAAGIIGRQESGNVAWKKAIPTGAVIKQIGNRVATDERPLYFEDVLSVVLSSSKGYELTLVYEVYEPLGDPDAKPRRVEIKVEPRKDDDDGRPMLGVSPPDSLELATEQFNRQFTTPLTRPVVPNSAAAAARAAVDLKPGDTVLATTDPDNAGRLKDLATPAVMGGPELFELAQRFLALAGKPMTLRVRRAGAGAGEATVDLDVPEAGFQFGDLIVACTNPDKGYQLDPLPRDPRNPDSDRPDYFEFHRRQQLLAGRFLTVKVRRQAGGEQELIIPPAYHHTLGLRMGMGPVTAVREGSPAEAAKVQEKDVLQEVLLTDGGGQEKRFLLSAGGTHEAGAAGLVDPVRLPGELRNWAAGRKDVQATLTVRRTDPETGKEGVPVTLPRVAWDFSWRFNFDRPGGAAAPLSVPELGLAYRIRTTVEAAEGPAADAVHVNDQVKAVRFKEPGKKPGETKDLSWSTLKDDQWAWVFVMLQVAEVKDVDLQLVRGDTPVTVTAQPDPTWPIPERGLVLMPDTRLQKANGVGQALWMGVQDTWNTILDVYYSLRGMLTWRISPMNVHGPIGIGRLATILAGRGFWELLFFLGMISANLAVINFLPIPFLDGGHMVFLIYEKIRGRPAPESVVIGATYVGLLLLLVLMISVVTLDLWRNLPLLWNG